MIRRGHDAKRLDVMRDTTQEDIVGSACLVGALIVVLTLFITPRLIQPSFTLSLLLYSGVSFGLGVMLYSGAQWAYVRFSIRPSRRMIFTALTVAVIIIDIAVKHAIEEATLLLYIIYFTGAGAARAGITKTMRYS